jgi:hypothetical protein
MPTKINLWLYEKQIETLCEMGELKWETPMKSHSSNEWITVSCHLVPNKKNAFYNSKNDWNFKLFHKNSDWGKEMCTELRMGNPCSDFMKKLLLHGYKKFKNII